MAKTRAIHEPMLKKICLLDSDTPTDKLIKVASLSINHQMHPMSYAVLGYEIDLINQES